MARELPAPAKLADIAFLARKPENVGKFDYFKHMFGKHVVTSVRPLAERSGFAFEIKGTSIVKLTYDESEQLRQIDWLTPNKKGNHLKMHMEYGHISVNEYAPNDTKFLSPLNSWSVLRNLDKPSDLKVYGRVTVQEKITPGLFSPKVDKTYDISGPYLSAKEIKLLGKAGFDPKLVSIMEMLGDRDYSGIDKARKISAVNIFASAAAGLATLFDYVTIPSTTDGIALGALLFVFGNIFRSLNRTSAADENTLNGLKNELSTIKGIGGLNLYLSTLLYHSIDVFRSTNRKMKYVGQDLKSSLFG